MNLPSAFLTRMQEMLGEEYEAFLQSYESGHYQSLRLNPRKTDREEFMEKSPFHLTPVAWEKRRSPADPDAAFLIGILVKII